MQPVDQVGDDVPPLRLLPGQEERAGGQGGGGRQVQHWLEVKKLREKKELKKDH